MKKVTVSNLPVRTYIDQPVFLDEKFILLSPDIPISKELVDRLSIWEYSHVLTDGTPSDMPASHTNSSGTSHILEEDLVETQKREEAITFYMEKVTIFDDILRRIRELNEIRISQITEFIKDIMTFLKSHRKYILSVPYLENTGADYISSASVKATILTLAIGDYLKMPAHKLIDLGSAALLHKIGMTKIPKSVYLSQGVLSDQEKKTIYAHPIIGFKMLKAASFPMPVAMAVLEHSEKEDGSGYPRKLKGNQISVFGKIIAVAVAYNGAVSKRPYKVEHDGHTGIMDLLKDIGRYYDEKILRALVFTLTIYPIGTYVALSNGCKGIVIKNSPESPKYPAIKLLINEKGQRYAEQPVLQTRVEDAVRIIKSLSKDEIDSIEKMLG